MATTPRQVAVVHVELHNGTSHRRRTILRVVLLAGVEPAYTIGAEQLVSQAVGRPRVVESTVQTCGRTNALRSVAVAPRTRTRITVERGLAKRAAEGEVRATHTENLNPNHGGTSLDRPNPTPLSSRHLAARAEVRKSFSTILHMSTDRGGPHTRSLPLSLTLSRACTYAYTSLATP